MNTRLDKLKYTYSGDEKKIIENNVKANQTPDN